MKTAPWWTLAIATALLSLAATETALAQGVTRSVATGLWSSSSTWSAGVPVAGDTVIIAPANTVTLDTNVGIADLAHLDVRGTLIVADTMTYALGASRIDVGANGSTGAVFQVGTAGTPFVNGFTITLTQNYLPSTYGDPKENKSFVVHAGATLDLHGNPVGPGGVPKVPWLRLAAGNDLPKNVSSMTLESPPGWAPNDQIVITSTDFDMNQAEQLTVTGVAGAVVTFSNPMNPNGLTYGHHGSIERNVVDERAEVGLLTRNVKIQGDALSATTGIGGHLMAMNGMGAGPAPTMRISWTEFERMGKHGYLGRYPIHWHLIGAAPGNYVRNSSIHHCYQRSVTVHGTHQVQVSGNVAYDSWGHMFFLENGSEIQNDIVQNLGLVTRTPPGPYIASPPALGATWAGGTFFVASDAEPSTFWITNTDNTVHDNAAAGSEAHGFWYDLQQTPLNPLPGPGFFVIPVRFERNVAHSNGIHGFFQEAARMVTLDATPPNATDGESLFVDFTAYKNRGAGVWHRSYGISRWIDTRLADNQFGFYVASEGFQQDEAIYVAPYLGAPWFETFHAFPYSGAPGFSLQLIEFAEIIGESTNTGNWDPTDVFESALGRSIPHKWAPEEMLKGVEVYDGLIGVIGCTFYDFVDVTLPQAVTTSAGTFNYRPTAGISSRGQHSRWVPGNPWGVDPRNLIGASSFVNVSNPVLFPVPHGASGTQAANGVASAMIYDVDGSTGNGANVYVANHTPLLDPTGAAPVLVHPHYAAPLVVDGPGSAGDHAYGQILMTIGGGCPAPPLPQYPGCSWNANPNLTNLVLLSVTAKRTNQSQLVADGQGSTVPWLRRFPFNVLLNHPGAPTEDYAIDYAPPHVSTDDPRNFELRLKFADPLRHALLDVAYDGVPAGDPPAGPLSVTFTNDTLAPTGVPPIVVTTPAPSLNALKTGNGFGYFYDSTMRRLYLRPTILPPFQPWHTPGVYPVFGGREIVVEVRG